MSNTLLNWIPQVVSALLFCVYLARLLTMYHKKNKLKSISNGFCGLAIKLWTVQWNTCILRYYFNSNEQRENYFCATMKWYRENDPNMMRLQEFHVYFEIENTKAPSSSMPIRNLIMHNFGYSLSERIESAHTLDSANASAWVYCSSFDCNK